MNRAFSHRITAAALVAAAFASFPVSSSAAALAPRAGAVADSAKKVLTPADYGRWRTISDQSIAPDGKWVTWVYRFTNVASKDEKPELHILNLDNDQDVTVTGASGGAFSPDGRWIVYQVDSIASGGRSGGSEGSARAGRGGTTTHHRMELRELATGTTVTWRDMQSATFNQASTFVLVRNRPAPRRGGFGGFGGRGGSSPVSAQGSDALLYDLNTGRARLLGSVGDAAFNRDGDMLAYTVGAEVKDGNGIYVVDLATGATTALDNAPEVYGRLTWNDAGTGLAVLKGDDVKDMLHRNNTLLVYSDVRAALKNAKLAPASLDTTAAGFPHGWVISDRASLSWSEDGGRVFLGAMPQAPAKDTVKVESSDSTTDVDVWGTKDRYIQSVQMGMASRERNQTYTQAFDVARKAFVALSDSTLAQLDISEDGKWAVGQDDRAYISDWKPDRADFYRVNTATGERTLMAKGHLTRPSALGLSPDGTKYLFWETDHFEAYDLASGRTTKLGANIPALVDTLWDYPGPKPSWGVQGFTADGKSVIVEDRFDLWTLPLDGGAARNITNGYGAANQVALRMVRTAEPEPTASRRVRSGREWDLSRPVTLSAFGDQDKKAGYFRLAGGKLNQVVYADARFSTPEKATHADRFLFTRESFTESPDLRVSGADFASAKKLTDSNPQQAEYRWGHSVLIDYTDRFGHPLKGMLWIPDDYKPGEKRPGLVTFYEKQSQNLDRYPMPELFVSMGRPTIEAVSRGYVAVIADIWYNTGSSHEDQLDGVEAATRKAIELGYLDPEHIGVHGHSYGGEGAAYIGVKSKMFAAVGEGSGVVDIYTDFSQEWGWSYQNSGGSGANGAGYYWYSQGRWGFSPWDKPAVYRDQSALSFADQAHQPFLILHGTADPTVSFNESLKFYNALRFNEKPAWLLAYPGEGHHLSKLGNRIDFTTRFYQFFDHYLKGAPAPKWMTDGAPYLTKAERADPTQLAGDTGAKGPGGS